MAKWFAAAVWGRRGVLTGSVWLLFAGLGGCGAFAEGDTLVIGGVGLGDIAGSIDTLIADSKPDASGLDSLPLADVGTETASGPDSAECVCPAGYQCFDRQTGAQPTCVPLPQYACSPCTSNATCLGGVCADLAGGRGCLTPCAVAADGSSSCGAGFACQPVEGSSEPVCVPSTGDCSCTATQQGQSRACSTGGAGLGICAGVQTCEAAGWSVCLAQPATAETCNGLDDDCDGLTDEATAGGACGIAADPFCQGTLQCNGPAGLSCTATPVGAETCDGRDEDCDGQTDEDFLTDGAYLSLAHCGGCDAPCALPNATAVCALADGKPACLVAACDFGFVPAGPAACQPAAALACQPCTADSECGGLCAAGVCQPYCSNAAPCGAGFACTPDAGGGASRCLPVSGTCDCTVASAGQTRACATSNNAGSCSGVQVCNPTQGWSACSAAIPASESCNKQDDDCDGQTDEVVGLGLPCNVANEHGSCIGTQVCTDTGPALQCVGQVPAAEACNQQDDDCDGGTDEGFRDATTGQYTRLDHCGSCNNACPAPYGAHALAVCSTSGTSPTCAMTCEPNWVDMDGVLANGCECLFQSTTDEPDGVDQNCDGIDGEVDNGIFVAKTGADSNPGSRFLPVASIVKALELAAATGKRDIYVAGGVYPGSLDLVAGISIYGGYGPGFGARDTVTFQSAVVGIAPQDGPSYGIRCQGIAGAGPKTRVDGLSILAASAKGEGNSSYGVLVIDCDARLQLTYNAIAAGDGSAGRAGLAGANGNAGLAGSPGQNARDIGKPQCEAADHTTGGSAGVALCGEASATVDVSGGSGGDAICPVMDEETPTPVCPSNPFLQIAKPEETGKPGSGPAPGQGGGPGADSYIDSNFGAVTQCNGSISCNTCRVPVQPRDGQDGTAGQQGPPGAAGSGGSALAAGTVSGGQWAAAFAGDGGNGAPGSGGGGGGAAGGVEVHDCAWHSSGYPDLGGSGGGGGSGGCGGTGGKGAGAGGGSFAVFLAASATSTSAPVLVGNTLTSGNGGAGGVGGPAGSGGQGGMGGVGGDSGESWQATFCTSKGGRGGDGGNGGHGGGGGGGAGGPSVLLAVSGYAPGSASNLQKANSLKTLGSGGPGGQGGPSIGIPGQTGQTGAALPVLQL